MATTTAYAAGYADGTDWDLDGFASRETAFVAEQTRLVRRTGDRDCWGHELVVTKCSVRLVGNRLFRACDVCGSIVCECAQPRT
jgi:hypothetical protein